MLHISLQTNRGNNNQHLTTMMITNANDGTEAAAAAADQSEVIIEEASTSNHKHLGNNGNKSTLVRVCMSTGLLLSLVGMVLLLVDVLGQPADSVMMTAGQLVSKATKAPAATAKTTKAPKTGGGGGCPWPLGTKLCDVSQSGEFQESIELKKCPTVEAEGGSVGVYVFYPSGRFVTGAIDMDTFKTPSSFDAIVRFSTDFTSQLTLLGTGAVELPLTPSYNATYSATACT
jgi:hypothetical protein